MGFFFFLFMRNKKRHQLVSHFVGKNMRHFFFAICKINTLRAFYKNLRF